MRFKTVSEQDTLSFAAELAAMLNAGDTVLLHGDLGTGKSVLARGIARALGIHCAMPSPTFTIMIPYEGTQKLYHFDLYRLADSDEFYEAGLDEFVGGDGIAVIEWPEMADFDADPSLSVTLSRAPEDDDIRILEIKNNGVDAYKDGRLAKWEWKI